MSDKKFNLKNYKKTNGDEHIDMRLEKQRSEAPNVINERQLDDYRSTESNVSIEKMLENNRTGEETEVTEKRLDTHKSKFANKYRNPEAYEGDINKLEEQRLNGNPVEDEKYELASQTPSQNRWWEEKSPDGLKLAKRVTAAKDDEAGEMSFDRPRWENVGEDFEPAEYTSKEPEVKEDFEIDEEVVDPTAEDYVPPVPEGSMKVLKEKDIYQPNRPDLSGIYFQLGYDSREFGKDKQALMDEIIAVIAERRPSLAEELNGIRRDKEVMSRTDPTVDPAIFDYMDIDEGKGLISVALTGPEWASHIKQDEPMGPSASPVITESKPKPRIENDKFIEMSHEVKDVDGTPMAIGIIRSYEDITNNNKENIADNVIQFVKQHHPDITIDKSSLDFSKVDENKIQYMVGISDSGMPKELSADEEFAITENRPETEVETGSPEEMVEDEADYQRIMNELNAPDEEISQDETPLETEEEWQNRLRQNTAASKKN